MNTNNTPTRAVFVTSDGNEEARVQPGFKGTSTAISKEYRAGSAAAQVLRSDKEVATAIAMLALSGVEARPLADDAWMLFSSSGARVATVYGRCALCVAAAGHGAMQRDLATLVQRKAVVVLMNKKRGR